MRIIDADRLIFADGGNDNRDFDFVLRMQIDNAPTVDAVPVVHGEWKVDSNGTIYCTVCGCSGIETDYCPHCGARME